MAHTSLIRVASRCARQNWTDKRAKRSVHKRRDIVCYCRVEEKKKKMQTNEYLRRLATIIMDEEDRKDRK